MVAVRSASASGSSRVPGVSGVARLVLRRPRPWVLRYLLATVPALVTALMLMFSLRPWFRVPHLLRGLKTRSLDHLLEAIEFAGPQVTGGPMLALALLLIPVAWLLVRALDVFIEGGVLATYAGSESLSWRAFLGASRYWFWPLCLLGVIWLLATVALAVATLRIGRLAGSLWYPLSPIIISLGAMGIVMLWMWFSLARSVTVARGDRNVFRALRGAASVIGARPTQLLALVAVTLALQVGLLWVSRAGTAVLPYSWWLPVLILQQLAAVLAMGVTLARRAGEITLAVQVFAPEVSDDV